MINRVGGVRGFLQISEIMDRRDAEDSGAEGRAGGGRGGGGQREQSEKKTSAFPRVSGKEVPTSQQRGE